MRNWQCYYFNAVLFVVFNINVGVIILLCVLIGYLFNIFSTFYEYRDNNDERDNC